MGNSCCCTKTYTFENNGKEGDAAASEATASSVATDGNHGSFKKTEKRYATPEQEPEGGWREMPVDVGGIDNSRASKPNANGEVAVVKPTKKTHVKTVSIDTSDTNFDPSLNLALATPKDDHTKLVNGQTEQGFTNTAFDPDASSDEEVAHVNFIRIERPKSIDVDAYESDSDQDNIMRSSAKITVTDAGIDNPAYPDSLSEDEEPKPASHTTDNLQIKKKATAAIAVKHRVRSSSQSSLSESDSVIEVKKPADADIEGVDLTFSGDNFPDVNSKKQLPRKQEYSDSDSESDKEFVPMPATAVDIGAKDRDSSNKTSSISRVLAPATSGMRTQLPDRQISETDSLEDLTDENHFVIPHLDIEKTVSSNKVLPGINEDIPPLSPSALEPNVPYAYEDEDNSMNASHMSAQLLLGKANNSEMEQTESALSSEEKDMQNIISSAPGPTLASLMREETEADELRSATKEDSPKKMVPVVTVTKNSDSSSESSSDEDEEAAGGVKTTPARKISVSSTSSSSSSSSSSSAHEYLELIASSPITKTAETLDDSDVELNFDLQSPDKDTPMKTNVDSLVGVGATAVAMETKLSDKVLPGLNDSSDGLEYSFKNTSGGNTVSEEAIVPIAVKRKILPSARDDEDESLNSQDHDIAILASSLKKPIVVKSSTARTHSSVGSPVSEDDIIPESAKRDPNQQSQVQIDPSLPESNKVSEEAIVPIAIKRKVLPSARDDEDESLNSQDHDNEILAFSLKKPIVLKTSTARTHSPVGSPITEEDIVPESSKRDPNQRLVVQMDPSLLEGMDDFDSDVDHPVIDRPLNESSLHARRDSSSSCSEEEMAEVVRVDQLRHAPHREPSPAGAYGSLEVIEESEVTPEKPAAIVVNSMDVNELDTTINMSEENILLMPTEEDEDSPALKKALDDLSQQQFQLWEQSDDVLQEDAGFIARPLPGVNTEDEIENWYQKELSTLNTGHSKWLKAAKDANFDENKLKNILKDYKRNHRHFWLQRQAERERVLGKLEGKLAARKSPETSSDKNNNDFGASLTKISAGSLKKKPLLMAKSLSVQRDATSSEDDSDVDADAILEKYGELVKESDSDDSPIEGYYISNSEEGSSSDCSETAEIEILSEDDADLKLTLTHDIHANLPKMTVDDFKQLMDLYRKERQGLRQMREGERDKLEKSLWARLEAKRLATIKSESEKMDEDSINGTIGTTTTRTTKTTTSETGSQVTTTTTQRRGTSNGVEQTDTATGMQNTLVALDNVLDEGQKRQAETEAVIRQKDTDFLEKVSEAQAEDRLSELMAAHLESRRRLRLRRDENLAKCRERLAAKLATQGSGDQEDAGLSHGEKLLVTSKDDQLKSDLRQIDQELLDKVEEQSRCDLDAEVIEKLLAKHQQEENQLLQKRQLEKQRMKQKMEERLRERQKTQEKLEEAEAAKEDVSLNEQLEKMDGDFYQAMLDKRQQGEINDDDVTKMVANHLKRVDEFMAKLNLKIPGKKKSIKQKKTREVADPSKVNDLVEQEQQQRDKVKKMRRQEREQMESKMQQKLRQKKQPKMYNETPELPPPKRPSTGKKQKLKPSPEDRMDYENVQIFDV